MTTRFIAVLMMLCLGGAAFAQDAHDHETKADVPELTKFHGPIYQLWHKAWPAKDLVLLRKLAPAIDSAFVKLEAAKLPGILRDKKAAWEEQVKALGATVASYRKEVAGTDTAAVLKVAESLHSQYEGLVRLTRPPLKEVDNFHQSLYMLYHYYMPDYNFEKISSSVAELSVKMDTLNAVKLPERRKKIEPEFVKRRAELAESLKSLS